MVTEHTVALSSNITFRSGNQVKNRIFKSAMSEVLASKNHMPNKRLFRLYDTWAKGAVGLQVSANVMIDSNHLGDADDVVLENDHHLEFCKQWAEAGKKNTQFWMQLNHPGRQTFSLINKKPVTPSVVKPKGNTKGQIRTPRALTHGEIEDIIERFATSALLAKNSGFSGIQIHGAQGYLASQFLSPKTNQRTDQWGSSFKKRNRFVMAVYRAIRKEVGNKFPIGIKLNSSDFQPGGFSEEESMQVAELFNNAGIDLTEVSGGNYEALAFSGYEQKESTRVREAYFIEYSERIKSRVDTTLVLSSCFRAKKGMDSALNKSAEDMVCPARPLSLEKDLPSKLIYNEHYKITVPSPTTGLKMLDKKSHGRCVLARTTAQFNQPRILA